MATELEELLDQTRTALMAGDLAGLAVLAERTERLPVALPRTDPATAERLRGKAERNARLLQAAARGIRAARQRITEIGNAPVLSTYDNRGRRELVAAPSAAVPRRV